MLQSELANRSVEVLLETDVTGKTVTKYVSIEAAYIWPLAFVGFLGLLMALGLLAKLRYALHSLRGEIKEAERKLEGIREETQKASDRLAEIKSKLSEREKGAIDKALDEIDKTPTPRSREEQSKKKLWDMMKSGLEDDDTTSSS